MAPGTPPPIAFFNAFWIISFPDLAPASAAVGASSDCTLAAVLFAVVVAFDFLLLLRRGDVVMSALLASNSAISISFVTLIELHILSTQQESSRTTKNVSDLIVDDLLLLQAAHNNVGGSQVGSQVAVEAR